MSHARDEYRELIEIRINTNIPEVRTKKRSSFMMPGALHHARWMAKSIHCLKIWIFREQIIVLKGIRVWIVKIFLQIYR